MNFYQIFKPTAKIIAVTLFITLFLWNKLPKYGYQLYYPDYQRYPTGFTGGFNELFTSLVILVITANLVIMYREHRGKFWVWIAHALPVLIFCSLIYFALSHFFLGLTFSNYIGLTLWAHISALVFVIPGFYIYVFASIANETWMARRLAPSNIDFTDLQPEQVIKAMGEPINVFDFQNKKMFVYKRFKIIFSDGQIVDVQ